MGEAQTAFVKYVFLDVVGFTKERSVEAQADVIANLNQIVIETLDSREIKDDKRILIPTGDGMCIALVEVTKPFDIHLVLALDILKSIQKHNDSTEDKMRQFSVRIGLNENVDNLVTDVNGKLNVAGMGINTAQRTMSFADNAQILVSQTVYETLRGREKYMSAFSEFYATTKHDETLVLYQYIAQETPGLNICEPETFRKKSVPTKKISQFCAYYIAHCLQNQDFFISKKESNKYIYRYAGATILYFKASDSLGKGNAGKFDTFQPHTWKAGEATLDEQFKHYAEIEIYVLSALNEFVYSQLLAEFHACFEGYQTVFVSSYGVQKLKEDWPEIAKEFAIN